jgi:DNA-binding MarR family transcriptional regulator
MQNWHNIPSLPEPLQTQATGTKLRVGLPNGPATTFQLLYLPLLTMRTVDAVLLRASQGSPQSLLVVYRQSSGPARDRLRAAGIPFAGEDGRVFLRTPDLFVDRDQLTPLQPTEHWPTGGDPPAQRNPFAKRSSRVARWLLLHHEEPFSSSELARAVDLNPAAVSRVVRALDDSAFLRTARTDAGSRRRRVRLERPRELLETWQPLWQRRRIAHQLWDIGARDIDETLNLLGQATAEHDPTAERPAGWAIGGLAGAATLRRAVEPAEVVLWADAKELPALAQILHPEPTRGGRGALRVALAPDPWTLSLARRPDGGLRGADPGQLWLDCASEGERALEAAEAIADLSGWL